jgi:hypothetical protein
MSLKQRKFFTKTQRLFGKKGRISFWKFFQEVQDTDIVNCAQLNRQLKICIIYTIKATSFYIYKFPGFPNALLFHTNVRLYYCLLILFNKHKLANS